ncbi:MAG: GNAT family N-acetyltransferase [Myxococcota bacterium]|jgi:GNAT superfamily N-acetyltransferase|nr:GNAT family N-acetyltransferase [Myxococcota bacterium]
MEIRTLANTERGTLLDLLDGFDLPDGWRGRNYFRRYMDYDPSYADENVWVAVDGGVLLGGVQIFPRRIRVLGHAIPTGGLGALFTLPEHRGRRIARLLVEAAVDAMVERGMEISLLHAQRQDFFAARGWQGWTSERSLLRRVDPNALKPKGDLPTSHEIEFAVFDRERDLAAVKAIHSAYSASRSGTVVRDDDAWEGSLCLSGNPIEEFVVARQGGVTVAYARCTLLGGVLAITELGRVEEGASALASLVADVLAERDNDDLAPRGVSSRELRSAVMLPAFDDLQLTVALEHRGLTSHPIADPTAMLRCLNLESLADRLDIALFPDEGPARFLERILPRDALVFWPADRF